MQLTIKDKTLNIWSKKRILYTICFFMFCVIDQRTKTGSGLDGIIEMFRDMAGVPLLLCHTISGKNLWHIRFRMLSGQE